MKLSQQETSTKIYKTKKRNLSFYTSKVCSLSGNIGVNPVGGGIL